MVWVKLADEFPVHRKIRPLSDAAFRLHVSGLCWASQNLTDGCIPEDELHIVSDVRDPDDALNELIRRGIWHKPGHGCDGCPEIHSGWVIHDFLDLNPAAEDIKAKRELDAAKKRRIRQQKVAAERASLGDSPRDTPGDGPRDSLGESPGDSPQDTPGDSPQDSPARAGTRVPVPSRPVPDRNYDDRASAIEKPSSSSTTRSQEDLQDLAAAITQAVGVGTDWTNLTPQLAGEILQLRDTHGQPALVQAARAASHGTAPPRSPAAWLGPWRSIPERRPDTTTAGVSTRCAVHNQALDPNDPSCPQCEAEDDAPTRRPNIGGGARPTDEVRALAQAAFTTGNATTTTASTSPPPDQPPDEPQAAPVRTPPKTPAPAAAAVEPEPEPVTVPAWDPTGDPPF